MDDAGFAMSSLSGTASQHSNADGATMAAGQCKMPPSCEKPTEVALKADTKICTIGLQEVKLVPTSPVVAGVVQGVGRHARDAAVSAAAQAIAGGHGANIQRPAGSALQLRRASLRQAGCGLHEA